MTERKEIPPKEVARLKTDYRVRLIEYAHFLDALAEECGKAGSERFNGMESAYSNARRDLADYFPELKDDEITISTRC